ncbi:MAG: toxin-antitoxin system YwqK family antitoxin [Flavobacteriales bacterium]|nr:toxin-antitoxin system YwqK family antitoxin [Flavobacteriales bacterium]
MKALIPFLLLCLFSLSSVGQKPGLQWPAGREGTDYNKPDAQGKKDGPWVRAWKTNTKILYYKGQFAHGVPVGIWEFYYDTGELQSKVDHLKDSTENYVVNYDRSMHTPISEGLYIGRMVNGKWTREKSGPWKLYNVSGVLIAEESYSRNMLHGQCRYYYPSGKLYMEVNYENGEKSGPSIEYYEDGRKKMESSYLKGQFEGKLVHYYPSGALQFEGQYKDGLKTGVWTNYHPDARVELTISFENGKEKNRRYVNGTFTEYYEGGIPKSEYTYEKGKKDGPFTEWYDQGEFVFVPGSVELQDDAIQGTQKLVGDQVSREGDYMDDKLEGEVRYYTEDGKLQKTEIWQAGVLIETIPGE